MRGTAARHGITLSEHVARSCPPLNQQGGWLAWNLERGAKAAGANAHALKFAIDHDALLMHVWLEGTIGLGRLALPATGRLVANVAPEHDMLVANLASGHGIKPHTTATAARIIAWNCLSVPSLCAERQTG